MKTEQEKQAYDKFLRGRFVRKDKLLGWQVVRGGLLLLYTDGSREVLEMNEKEALENSDFLAHELGGGLICLTYDQ